MAPATASATSDQCRPRKARKSAPTLTASPIQTRGLFTNLKASRPTEACLSTLTQLRALQHSAAWKWRLPILQVEPDQISVGEGPSLGTGSHLEVVRRAPLGRELHPRAHVVEVIVAAYQR